MALISDITPTWSAPVILTQDEVWQTRKGSVFVTTTTSPATDDGLHLHETHAVQFSAGQSVRYRKDGATDALLVREAV